MKYFIISMLFLSSTIFCEAQDFTHADTLRGSLNANRTWWHVTYYDLKVEPNLKAETITGSNTIYFKVLNKATTMQIDLQKPLEINKIIYKNSTLKYTRDGNVFLVYFPIAPKVGNIENITINYSGKPRKAVNAPWDGGIVWEVDDKQRPYINTACQGLGASVWWPCKDHQTEESDSTQISITVPKGLTDVSNGRLRKIVSNKNGTNTFVWYVNNPINNYDVTMNIANYTHFKDTLNGEKGVLDMDYWVLDYNLDKAKKQFVQAKQTVRAFEYWFGPYPFYDDSYKLVETHHLGMEHQSAVAYGNHYMNGYLGNDLSGSGWGNKWDYIIVHESGHEWFGNNITTKDIADSWVHEGITDYSETLFTEYYYGKDAANEYTKGIRRNIENAKPVIGKYDVNNDGSSDMYYKGSNLMHTIRQLINNDEKFRQILRGLNKDFYHQTVTSKQVEDYISLKSGIDFSKIFDQYLRTIKIPRLLYYFKTENNINSIYLKFNNCVDGFGMIIPVNNTILKNGLTAVNVTDKEFNKFDLNNIGTDIKSIINQNLYIQFKKSEE